jgi:hypothetical protein
MSECWKKMYPSKKHALQALKRIRKQGYIMSPNAYAYKCPSCEGWHLGHDKFKYHNEKR